MAEARRELVKAVVPCQFVFIRSLSQGADGKLAASLKGQCLFSATPEMSKGSVGGGGRRWRAWSGQIAEDARFGWWRANNPASNGGGTGIVHLFWLEWDETWCLSGASWWSCWVGVDQQRDVLGSASGLKLDMC